MIPAIAALIAVLLLITSPAIGPLALVLAVNLYLWGYRFEMRRHEVVQARALAEIRRERESILAWKSIP